MTTTDTSAPRKAKSHRPMRDNLEGFAIAILFAVLLKPFVIEAYQIPTPSMQPTMMGSTEAGVHDRLLVDKVRYELVEPQRFDICVFRFPIRTIQNYVKRIVGMPGDRFIIGCGDIVPVDAADNELAPIRKPDRIQSRQWREIFPARMEVDGKSSLLDYFSCQPSRSWKEFDGALTTAAEKGRSVTLAYVDAAHNGLSDQLWDGYPTAVARAIRDQTPRQNLPQGVQDARFACSLQPSSEIEQLEVDLVIRPAGKPAIRYLLRAAAGQGRLLIEVDRQEVAASEPFPLPLPPGQTTSLRFTHVDGMLFVEHDGDRAGELACYPHIIVDDVEPRAISLTAAVRGGGSIRFDDLVVERDMHYKLYGDGDKGKVYEVPEGHYFMMGDNPDQSADARAWAGIEVGVTADGRLVNPREHPEARIIAGNLRPRGLNDPPDADENPVLVPEHETVVFTDLVGEVHSLRGKAHLSAEPGMQYGRDGVWFEGDGGPWTPKRVPVSFVPRKHILGRPLLTFWPIWPFGPNRLHFIR